MIISALLEQKADATLRRTYVGWIWGYHLDPLGFPMRRTIGRGCAQGAPVYRIRHMFAEGSVAVSVVAVAVALGVLLLVVAKQLLLLVLPHLLPSLP